MERTPRKNIEDHFEVEESQLEATLERFLADEKVKPKTSKVNISTVSGMVILIISMLYIMETMFTSGVPAFSGLLHAFTIIGGILVLLTGSGLFTRNGRSKRKRRNKLRWNFLNSDPMDSYGLRQKKRLYRSKRDKKLFGVCGGIAAYFNLDPTIVRIIFVLLALSYGSSILVYVILAMALPKETLIDDY